MIQSLGAQILVRQRSRAPESRVPRCLSLLHFDARQKVQISDLLRHREQREREVRKIDQSVLQGERMTRRLCRWIVPRSGAGIGAGNGWARRTKLSNCKKYSKRRNRYSAVYLAADAPAPGWNRFSTSWTAARPASVTLRVRP